MPMARAFPAFCLLFRHPSRATKLRDDGINDPERRPIQSNNILLLKQIPKWWNYRLILRSVRSARK